MIADEKRTPDIGSNARTSVAVRPGILIVDDDPIIRKIMERHMQLSFPEARVETTADPVPIPGYDIYLLDNDFDGRKLAADLVAGIRTIEPHALIVAMSRTLDLPGMQDLVNLGCNAVYDKGDPGRSAEARMVMANYIAVLQERQRSQKGNSFKGLLRSINDLLRQWNARLTQRKAE